MDQPQQEDEYKNSYPDQTPPNPDIEQFTEPQKTTEPTHEAETQPEMPIVASPLTPPVPSTVPAPIIAPAATVEPEKPSAGMIVLQWLTYAFWGWTVLAMSILVVIVLSFFLVKGANVGDAPIYSMAAVLVLLPISVICDIFYMKHEPVKKVGAASVVMIIHAVIFALFGIGAIITIVFSMVNLLISASSSETTFVFLYSAIIIAILYALVFVRTILPKFLFKFRKIFIILMVAIVGVMSLCAILGPTMEARITRNDKLIENGLSGVNEGITSYANKYNSLPATLDSLTLTGDSKKLVTDNLVTYKKDSAPYGAKLEYPTFYYQLCVSYTKASKYQGSDSSSNYYSKDDGYSTYPNTYSHGAGKVCYRLKAEVYN